MRVFHTIFSISALIPVFCAAQTGFGTLNMETKLGAFKIKRYNLVSPAEGRVEISFTGSLLIFGYEGKPFEPTMKGLRIEFPDPKVLPAYTKQNFDKIVLQGKGSVILDGKFMALQWLGRDMKAKWTGRGVIYLYGEFDQNEKTGVYWLGDPTKKRPWQMPNERMELPVNLMGGGGRPQPRPKGGGAPPKPAPKKPGG
ncbi:MAG: hypothetical protein WAO58_04555 [Fimbriimonadaceae bacterium]